MDFCRDSMIELASQVRAGELSARDLVEHALSRIDALNPLVNAFVAVDGERALVEAAAVDSAVAAGRDPGPLAGIPFGVKDLEDAAGFVTTEGSVLFADDPPAQHDSILVARLKAAGAIVVGKTNTPELGHKGDTDNAVFGATSNPWNLEHSAGGSSGGTAAAIAAGMVPLGTGSDGGGSIRIPSSCCGLSGMKPSLGRIPSGGPRPPDWMDLSTRGPMARRIADVVAALDVAVGPDPSDLRSLPRPEASWPATLRDARVPSKVAWSPTLGYAPLDDEVRAICTRAVEVLVTLGSEVIEVPEVFDEDPVNDWLTLVSAYCARTLSPFRNTDKWQKVDPLLAAMAEHAATNTSAEDLVRADRRVPHAQSEVGRAVPRCEASGHTHLRGAAAAPVASRHRGRQRCARGELGPLHLSVQHDQIAGRNGLRGDDLEWPSRRAPAGRPPTRRSCRSSVRGRTRGGDRLRRGPCHHCELVRHPIRTRLAPALPVPPAD